MAIVNGYTTLDELKARFDVIDDKADAILEQTIEAASRQIDGMCGRHFYYATETHYYEADSWEYIETDDIVSVTTLATDEDASRDYATSWGPTDFELGPGESEPYTRIYAAPLGAYAFPVLQRRGVRVVGVFGWTAVPHAIREATLLSAARLFKRKDAPMGAQIGNQQLGALSIPGKDPDVMRLIEPYRKYAVIGV